MTSKNQPLQLSEKRTALAVLAYLRNTEANGTQTRWVHGESNLADGLTKLNASHMLRDFMLTSTWSVVHDENSLSGKKRRAKGLAKLENQAEQDNDVVPLLTSRLKEAHPEYFLEDRDPDEDDLYGDSDAGD